MAINSTSQGLMYMWVAVGGGGGSRSSVVKVLTAKVKSLGFDSQWLPKHFFSVCFCADFITGCLPPVLNQYSYKKNQAYELPLFSRTSYYNISPLPSLTTHPPRQKCPPRAHQLPIRPGVFPPDDRVATALLDRGLALGRR